MEHGLSFVYIMTNRRNGTLYIGVTSNIQKRIWEHKNHMVKGFTEKYDLTWLVYYEIYPEITLAIQREKQLKSWNRSWKTQLIEKINPEWNDLYKSLN